MNGKEFIEKFYEGYPNEVNLIGVTDRINDGEETWWHIHRDEEVSKTLRGFRFSKLKGMKNEFSLYKSTADKERLVEIEKCETEFTNLWNEFIDDWRKIGSKYALLGATDTASRDAQVRWIRKQKLNRKMCLRCNKYIVFREGLCSGCIKEPEEKKKEVK